MPSFNTFKELHHGNTIGEQHKYESDMIMETTWDTDIATRDMYFYDYYHDDHKTQLNALNPINDSKKVKMRCKYLVNSSQNYESKDISYHLQLRPFQDEVVDYYDDVFRQIYMANYPIGLYVDIPDSKRIFNRWLVVAEANYNDPQFPTFELLRCNYILQYIVDGIKYNVPTVLRSQSYSGSGIWTSGLITSPDDQQKFCVPMNRDTERIYYNQRMVIDNKVINREPKVWQVTNVNAIDHNGVEVVTLTQGMFDEHTDKIEYDSNGNITGMWCDYWKSNIEPKDQGDEPVPSSIYAEITYSGLKPEIKSGGSPKKFTVKFYYADGTEAPFEPGTSGNISGGWSGTMYGKNGEVCNCDIITDLLSQPTIDKDNPTICLCSSGTYATLDENQIALKFVKDDTYIGHILKISYASDAGVTAEVEMEVVAL